MDANRTWWCVLMSLMTEYVLYTWLTLCSPCSSSSSISSSRVVLTSGRRRNDTDENESYSLTIYPYSKSFVLGWSNEKESKLGRIGQFYWLALNTVINNTTSQCHVRYNSTRSQRNTHWFCRRHQWLADNRSLAISQILSSWELWTNK